MGCLLGWLAPGPTGLWLQLWLWLRLLLNGWQAGLRASWLLAQLGCGSGCGFGDVAVAVAVVAVAAAVAVRGLLAAAVLVDNRLPVCHKCRVVFD